MRCKCGTKITLSCQNNKVVISNLTRHLLKSCQKYFFCGQKSSDSKDTSQDFHKIPLVAPIEQEGPIVKQIGQDKQEKNFK